MTGKSASLAVNIVADASRAVAAFDDTGEAGKRMADLIGKSADKLERELEATRKIADRLATALGPEMADAFGQSKIDDYARQMAKAGVSIEEVDANAEELARQLARLDDVTMRSARSMTDEMDKVGKVTDNSRSVMANFAGNAAQELPLVTAAFGPLNTAIGQFVEYAADGNIKMSGLLTFTAPIVAAAAGFAVVNEILGNQREIAESTRQSLERYKDSFMAAEEEGVSAAQALADEWRQLGKVEVALPYLVDASGQPFEKGLRSYGKEVVNITDDLADLGITIGQFSQLVLAQPAQVEAWRRSMVAAGLGGEQLATIMQAIEAEHANATEAAKQHGIFTQVFGENVKTATELLNPYAEKLRDVEAGLWGLNDAQAALISLQTGQRSNVTNYTRSLSELSKVIDDPNTAINEQAVALEEAFAAGKDIAANYADQQRELAGLAGTTFGANDALQAQIDSLGVLSWTLEPDSPLRRNLAGYITQLEQQILLNGIIAGQQLAGQPGRVSLGGDRAQEYRAIAAAGAAGIPTLAVPGANLIPGLTPNMGANWMPNTIVVNMPAGSDGESVVRSLQEWQRNHGAIPVTTISTVIP